MAIDSAAPRNPPFRAEHLGSLLRPQDLLSERTDFEQGKITYMLIDPQVSISQLYGDGNGIAYRCRKLVLVLSGAFSTTPNVRQGYVMESGILRCMDNCFSCPVDDFEARNNGTVGLSTLCMMALAVPKLMSKCLVVDNFRVKFAKKVTLSTSTGVL